jgi:hypothetical protein
LATNNNIGTKQEEYRCLIHIDRLSITFRHLKSSTFQNIKNPDFITNEQNFNRIILRHDNSPGKGAYYHSFIVYYDGYIIGRLFSGSKMNKPDLQFDFKKELFYSIKPDFWYEAYLTLKTELGIAYNNINCVEIAVDTNKEAVNQFGLLFKNSINNNLGSGEQFKMRKNTRVHVMSNGASFVIESSEESENKVAIYNKSHFSEKFILDYFMNNGLSMDNVNRIEARLKWNYIRSLINKKKMNINIETLLDPQKLATIFEISTLPKLTFYDLTEKFYDANRNPVYTSVSILEDLPIATAVIGKVNPNLQVNHYKKSVDESILRQNYYSFLECGNIEYLRNFKASAKVATINNNQLLALINKFNNKFMGDRREEIISRMEHAKKYITNPAGSNFRDLLSSVTLKLKWQLMGIF